MTDRVLLELAAKAAGIEIRWSDLMNAYYMPSSGKWPGNSVWNPINSDGDALRLAVKLGITIQHSATIDTAEDSIETFDSESRFAGWFEEVKGTDPYAATRRAIVRCIARRATTTKSRGKHADV